MLCGHGTSPDGCHSWVESFPNEAEIEGWHIRPWSDPETVPVKHALYGWCRLLPDGGIVELTEGS